MRSTLLLAVLALAAAGCSGSGDRASTGRGLATEATAARIDEAQVRADIAELAKGKRPEVAEDSVAYDQARDRLIAQGSQVEPFLHEAMKTSPDWGVRLGCVEAIQAIGTKASVEPLIALLDDPEPLVALYANAALEAMLGRSEIPTTGATGANGLPPVPPRARDDLDPGAEQRIWAAWHAANKAGLRRAWADWWAVSRETAVIDGKSVRPTRIGGSPNLLNPAIGQGR